MRKTVPKCRNFVLSNAKAKSEAIAKIVQIARKERLSYDDFLYICQQVRRKLGLRRPKRERKLPQLLGEADLKRSFRGIQDCGDVQHEILLKFLFFTAVRDQSLWTLYTRGGIPGGRPGGRHLMNELVFGVGLPFQ